MLFLFLSVIIVTIAMKNMYNVLTCVASSENKYRIVAGLHCLSKPTTIVASSEQYV